MTMSISHAAPMAALAVGLTLVLAACGSAAVPTIPPAASQPAASDPAPSQPVTDPTPVGGSQAPATRIVALNVQFDPVDIAVPAGEPLMITFDNRDSGIPHDLAIMDEKGNQIALTPIIIGPDQAQLAVGPLAPGSYPFTCTIHPNMVGTITAQ